MVGRLIYLMGPSGSGKDSLLDAVRGEQRLPQLVVARRVITRSAEAVGEAAQEVSEAEFAALEQAGEFALAWRANGLCYGIARSIDTALARGDWVLVNGSRGYLAQARERYPQLLPILLSVDDGVLRQRLIGRGRESLAEIEQRIARNQAFRQSMPGVSVLDNSAALAHTVQALLDLLQAQS